MFEIKDEAVATQVDVQSQTESGLCPSTHQEQDARELICANPAFKRLQNSSSVLLLQGPLGPFFDRLARWLKANGTQVNRVALHAGDLHDCKAIRPVTYKGPRDGWGEYVRQLIARHGVDCIVLFGQSRYYHVIAREVAAESGIAVVVLEEGYFRPGFITMELDGVNGYSRTLQRFRWDHATSSEAGIQADITSRHFEKMAWHASQHYLAMHKHSAQLFQTWAGHYAA